MEDLLKPISAKNAVTFNSLAVKPIHNPSVLNFCYFKAVNQTSATK